MVGIEAARLALGRQAGQVAVVGAVLLRRLAQGAQLPAEVELVPPHGLGNQVVNFIQRRHTAISIDAKLDRSNPSRNRN
jgi:hypothetical protein